MSKYIFSIIISILCFNNGFAQKSKSPKLTKQLDSIRIEWSSDTCGVKGKREKIINLLLEDSMLKEWISSADIAKIVKLLGKPDTYFTEDNGDFVYQYYGMLFKNSDGSCDHPKELEGDGLRLSFDNRSQRVIAWGQFME